MVGIHIEDHGIARRNVLIVVTELAGFADHDLTPTGPSAAADNGQLTADHRCGVLAGAHQHLGDHRGGCGLAVGAADRNAVRIVFGQQTQQFRPFQHGDTAGLGCYQLRIVRQDRGSVDDEISAFNVLRLLSDGDGDPQLPLRVDGIGGVVVRAGDVIAGCGQDLHQRIHTAAADANKMNMLLPLEDIGIRNCVHCKQDLRVPELTPVWYDYDSLTNYTLLWRKFQMNNRQNQGRIALILSKFRQSVGFGPILSGFWRSALSNILFQIRKKGSFSRFRAESCPFGNKTDGEPNPPSAGMPGISPPRRGCGKLPFPSHAAVCCGFHRP